MHGHRCVCCLCNDLLSVKTHIQYCNHPLLDFQEDMMVSLYLAQWNDLTPMSVHGAVYLPCTADAAGLVSLLS